MVADSIFVTLAWLLSVGMYSYLFLIDSIYLNTIIKSIPIAVIVQLILFAVFGLYSSMWKYASIGVFLRICFAVLATSFIIYTTQKIIFGFWMTPAIPVNAFYFSITFSAGIRFVPRIANHFKAWYRRRFDLPKSKNKTLIVGGGDATAMLIADIKKMAEKSQYNVVGIVDDDKSKYGLYLNGVEIIGPIKIIPTIVKKMEIDTVLISIPSASNELLMRIIDACNGIKCKIKIMPSIINASVKSIKAIAPEDLLLRQESINETKIVKQSLIGKRVLVTGGGGSIGSELCRKIMKQDISTLMIFDIYENSAYDIYQELCAEYPQIIRKIKIKIGSVTDEKRLEQIFKEFRPQIVFHAAAYKHVPLMEECPRLAIENNVFGTYNTIKVANKYAVEKFVFISTDKAVNPTNVMGASKRISEKIVTAFNELGKTESICVRFGNVLGSNGSVIPIFKRQIERGGPVKVTHPEVTRYFMTIPEAASLVIQAGAMAKGGEVFILDMGEPVKIKDLAVNMIRLSGFIPNIDIKIEYSGLRPGEKLYEELLTMDEQNEKTDNSKIFIAQLQSVTLNECENIISHLQDTMYDKRKLLNAIKKIVPEYTPADY